MGIYLRNALGFGLLVSSDGIMMNIELWRLVRVDVMNTFTLLVLAEFVLLVVQQNSLPFEPIVAQRWKHFLSFHSSLDVNFISVHALQVKAGMETQTLVSVNSVFEQSFGGYTAF